MAASTQRLTAGHNVSRVAAACPATTFPATIANAAGRPSHVPSEQPTQSHMWLGGFGYSQDKKDLRAEALT